MKRNYHTINKQGKAKEGSWPSFSPNGQLLLPMVDLIEQCRMACDELIDVAGRSAIQAVLDLSAQQVAGPRQQGKQRGGDVVWYGQQSGTVMLSDRKLSVQRPRLRKKGAGEGKEVEVPAYTAHARSGAVGRPHVGHPDARCFHAPLLGRDSRKWRTP